MNTKWLTLKRAKISLFVGIIVFVLAMTIMLVFPSIYKGIFKKEISLSEGTLATDKWKDIPFPIYERAYFFNITNAEDFVKRGAPLNVTQVGPYVFKSRWVKPHLHWHNNGTVSYREIRTYHFCPDLSSGTEDDSFYTLNGPMLIASSILKTYSLPVRLLMAAVLKIDGEEIIIQRTVRDLMYEGYKDDIIKLAPLIKPDIPFKDGRFSWLYGKNATDDGLFNVFTGRDDSSKINIVDKYNGFDRVTYWKGDTCNMINGTTLEMGPPFTSSQKTYTFFQSIFCRSLSYNYTKEAQLLGLTMKRFEPTFDTYANGTDNPDNACFDILPGLASGVIDVSGCQFGANVMISHPHFYMADSSYLNSINGLEPNNEDHSSYIGIEPNTGISIDFQIRLQLNVLVERVEGILQLDSIREGVFPVLWVELQGKIGEDLADELKFMLFTIKSIAFWTLGTVMVVSFILIILSGLAIFYINRHDREDDPLIDPKDDCKANGPVRSKYTDGLTESQTSVNRDPISHATNEQNKAMFMSTEELQAARAGQVNESYDSQRTIEVESDDKPLDF